MAVAAVRGEQLDKMLQCSICIDVFTDPRTLPCLHTFCVNCIADWCKDKQRGGKATCPECREEFVIPESGIDGLFITSMLKMNAKVQKTDNPQLLFTLDQPPTDKNGRPRKVFGLAMLDKYLCVVYSWYDKVQVFNCNNHFKKVKEIQVEGMRWPFDMIGCSVTSQLFVIDGFNGNIWRVNVNTGVCDVFIELGYYNARLSLVDNRLLVTSRYSLLMYDIHSGRRMKNILLKEDMTRYYVLHAIESNRNSFFVCHRQSEGGPDTVSEIDSEGRVIRVFDNKQQLHCGHLALDSVGRLLVVDWKNYSVVLLDKHLQFKNIILGKEVVRLDDAQPLRLTYWHSSTNNRLVVGFNNGHVKIFDCHV